MKDGSRIELEQLRQIGWETWNPIGLDDDWKAAAPDEYDPYLRRVAEMHRGGASKADATTYLMSIASHHMGLSRVDPQAAEAAVSAIWTYVESVGERR